MPRTRAEAFTTEAGAAVPGGSTRLASDAFRFLIPLLAAAALLAFASLLWLALIAVLLAGFVCYFFRNPSRVIPSGPKLIVSPADGKVVKIAEAPRGAAELDRLMQVSIFLNIFDVHINRAPMEGELARLEYRRGAFRAAYVDAASHANEQNILTIRGNHATVIMKQIAGLVARRVVCWKKPGVMLQRGEVLGLIRFGSRVDLLLPCNTRILVKEGERVKGGSSVIGELV
jgi:phosphatidylserine decarboxylase